MLLLNLLVSALMVAGAVLFHFFGLRAVIGLIQKRLGVHIHHGDLGRRMASLVAIMLSLVTLHAVEIFAYACLFVVLGAVPQLETAIYFSTAAFATLGSEDVVLMADWRLTGAIEGVAGFLLIGLSTAFLVTVIDRLGLFESLAHVGEKAVEASRDNVEP